MSPEYRESSIPRFVNLLVSLMSHLLAGILTASATSRILKGSGAKPRQRMLTLTTVGCKPLLGCVDRRRRFTKLDAWSRPANLVERLMKLRVAGSDKHTHLIQEVVNDGPPAHPANIQGFLDDHGLNED